MKIHDIVRNEELPLVDGCVYVTGIGHKGKEGFKIFCHKMVAEGSMYCPKHKAFTDDLADALQRHVDRRVKDREYREAEQAALALSPLRAENPDFEKKVTGTGYEDNDIDRKFGVEDGYKPGWTEE